MKLKARILVTGFAVALSSACAQGYTPKFEKIVCPADVKATECGYVIVPENRAKLDKTIKIFTAIVRNPKANKNIGPLVFLAGGPGEKASGYTQIAPVFPEFDVVVFDQRGIGKSQPALECPKIDALTATTLESTDAINAQIKAELIACGKTLRGKEIALEHYNATESAKDVEDLRVALGFGKINLYGGSYGTRLGQEVLRRFSSNLRAVVLDSVIPVTLDRSADTPFSIDESLKRVFAACKAGAACNKKYPNLEQVYKATLEQLAKKPFPVNLGGETSPFGDTALQGFVFSSLYFPLGIAEVPSLIYAARDRKAGPLETSFASKFVGAVSSGVSWGAFFSHECRGEVAFTKPQNVLDAYVKLPQWKKALDSIGISSTGIFEVCKAWGLEQPSGQENSALSSEVPTLLLGGEFDPVTPPRNLKRAVKGLTRATTIEFTGAAHIPGLSSECGIALVRTFLLKSSLPQDTSCSSKGKITFKLD